MEGFQSSRSGHTSRPQYHDPPPVAVPRSQFSNNVRTTPNRPNPDTNGPKYFSSPFRAPLNRQERQDSLIEHQKSISKNHDDEMQFPEPRYLQDSERTSYTFFGPHPAVEPLRITKKPRQVSPEGDVSDSGSQSSQPYPRVVRQASIGHKAKPSLTNVKRSDSTQTSKQSVGPRTPPRRTTADSGVLNATMAAEITKSTLPRPVRPAPHSPTSTYSEDVRSNHNLTSGQSNGTSHTIKDSLSIVNVYSPAKSESERLSPIPGHAPNSEKSSSSTNPLLGLGIDHQGMNKRIPEERRPPRLNMKAVDDLNARGSVTSLPELIRRATRLAANLDRGKTASRLGIWDMFSNADHGRKESHFTDVLDAFPDPANNTPSKPPRPTTMWPSDTKEGAVVSAEQMTRSRHTNRKCCGLSVTAFILVLVILVLLIAAAVLIPIFLIAVPRQNGASAQNLKDCAASYPCQNSGINMIDNNACSCVCVGGFTGSDCSLSADPNCVTADIISGSQTYHNATVGPSIKSLISQAGNHPGLSVNASVLLSVFAKNNLSCAGEDSLVQFDLSKRPRGRRSTSSSEASPMTSTSAQPLATASTTLSSADSAQTSTSNVTSDQIEFAQLVVLYVLSDTRAPSVAVLAQQHIQQYFRAGGLASGNSTVDVGHATEGEITVDFEKLSLA